MIKITRGNNADTLEKYTFKLVYSDDQTFNVFIEAENIMSAWATIGESQHMFAEDIFKKANLVGIELEKIGEHLVD